MENLRIEKFRARYHLPPSGFERKERLDRLLDEVLDAPLAMALERLGISPREEICIRRVHAPVRLKFSTSDVDLILDWSLALAERFFRIVSAGDRKNVVRYPSRLCGLFDFADCVARGDFQRAWAWNQMGFSVPRNLDSSVEAAKGLVASLIREPECIVPVLSRSTERGRIAGLLKRIPAVWWRDLATAALTAHGIVDGGPTMVSKTPVLEETDIARRRFASRIAKGSALAAAVVRERSWFSDHAETLPVWAIFVVLEQEPAVFRRDEREATSLLSAVEEEIGLAAGLAGISVYGDPVKENGAGGDGKKLGSQASITGDIREEEERGPSGKKAKFASPERGIETEISPESGVERDDVPVSQISSRRHEESMDSRGKYRAEEGPVETDRPRSPSDDGGLLELSQEEEIREDASGEMDGSLMARRRGYSEYGGLLFLLVLLERSGIADEIAGTKIVENRSMRWFLHALALCLLPVEENDPAALAFCGLRPGDSPPWKDNPVPNEEERRTLADWREKIAGELADSIYKDERELSRERILLDVCRRRAEIVADPGWIEAIFSIRDVSTDIRRAGLDLDPGFIPWLGVVFKFYYE